MFDHARAQPFERGHELVADPGAQEARVAIGRVDAVRDAVPRHVSIHVAATGLEHGPYPVAVVHGHRSEPARAGAAKDAHENGLGAVVRVVARGDPIGTDTRCCRSKSLPSSRSGAGLEVAPRRDGHARAPERDIE
jgi:hypothetical protein